MSEARPAVRVAAPRILAVVGSPRAQSNSAALAEAALDELAALGATCETIRLAERAVAPCLAHAACADLDACPLDDDTHAVLESVYAADGLILASPVYYENVSAQMKAFIDRNVFRYAHDQWLAARAVGLIAVTAETGLADTLAALRRYVALSTDREVPVFTLGGYAEGPGEAAADADLIAAAKALAAGMAAALGLSRAG